jgi:DHA2 family multidrug resistance protein-like MFS transporter
VALSTAGIMLMVLAVGVWLSLKGVDRQASKDG